MRTPSSKAPAQYSSLWGTRAWRKVRRLQAIIPHRTRCRQSDVHVRSPVLQFVMPVPVKQVCRSNRNSGRRRFDRRKARVIVHHVIRQKNLLPPAPPHIQRREIIERPRRSHSREQPIILFVPESVYFPRRGSLLFLGNSRRSRNGRIRLRSSRRWGLSLSTGNRRAADQAARYP